MSSNVRSTDRKTLDSAVFISDTNKGKTEFSSSVLTGMPLTRLEFG